MNNFINQYSITLMMDPNPHALSGACIPEFRFTAPEALAAEMAPRGLAFLYAVDTGFSHSTLVPQGEGMMRVASLEDRFLSTAELAQRHGELLGIDPVQLVVVQGAYAAPMEFISFYQRLCAVFAPADRAADLREIAQRAFQ